MTGVMERAMGEKGTSAHTKKGEKAQPHKRQRSNGHRTETQRERERVLWLEVSTISELSM
jgi:hypothetical protein